MPARVARSRRSWLRRAVRTPQFWFGGAVLAPTLVWYALLQFGPLLEAFYFSVIAVRILNLLGGKFIGLSNYGELFDAAISSGFGLAMANTVLWTILQFATVFPLALLTATCLTTVTRGRTVYQIVLFLPFVTPVVVVSQIMGQFFAPRGGLASAVLQAVDVPWRWLADPAFAGAMGAYIGAWHWLGFYTVLLTAGLLNIPQEVRDAASVDGAYGARLFRHITLPLIGHILVVVLLLLLINAVQESTLGIAGAEMVTTAITNLAFGQDLLIGPGAAGGALVCVGTLVVGLLIIKLLRPTWSY